MHDRTIYPSDPSIFTYDQFKEAGQKAEQKILEAEKLKIEVLDARWDDNKNIKENIIYIFQTDVFPFIKPKSTGFYNEKYSKMIADEAKEKATIIELISKDNLTLEACYTALYILQLGQREVKSQEIKIKVPYVIKRMEMEEPELKKLKL